MIVFAFLVIVWGTTWMAIKITIGSVPPFLGAALRFLVALLCLYIYAKARRISLTIPSGAVRLLLLSALLLYIFDYGLIYWGEQYLSSGVTAVFFATFPLFTALVANFVFHNEAFNKVKFFGVMMGFLGTAIVFYDQLLITRFDNLIILASVAIIISALATAFSTLIIKHYLSDIEAIALTFHQMVYGTLMLLAISLILGELPRVEFRWEALAAIGYLGVIGSALAFVLYYRLLQQMSAITTSYIIYFTPIVALIIGWLFLGEAITRQTIYGTAFILSGIAITQSKPARALPAISLDK